ncbi:protein of unknown function [Hyphomicrobium sp. 1Nfss2.1]
MHDLAGHSRQAIAHDDIKASGIVWKWRFRLREIDGQLVYLVMKNQRQTSYAEQQQKRRADQTRPLVNPVPAPQARLVHISLQHFIALLRHSRIAPMPF